MATMDVKMGSDVLARLDRIAGAAQKAEPGGSFPYDDVVDLLLDMAIRPYSPQEKGYGVIGRRLARRVKV